jgi:hypothetical protein
MRAAIDPEDTVVMWAYPGAGNVNGLNNKLLMYNWVTKKWSIAEIDSEMIFQSIATGYEFRMKLGIFNSTRQLAYLTGADMTATLETREEQFSPGFRSQVNKVRPSVDSSASASLTLSIGERDVQTDNVVYGSDISEETSDSTVLANTNARYHRMKLTIAGGFNHAQGLEVEHVKRGKV